MATLTPPKARKLLAWYDRNARDLPWRVAPGGHADPYKVWLSEIMLQQTTVATVKGYFAAFLERWPEVEDLAAADLDEVLLAWAGLGYYARARNLHKCAKVVTTEHAGKFPDNEKDLLALPGIGPYTAAAITSIAFGKRAVVVDGNVERVITRLFHIETPLPVAKPEIRAATDKVTPKSRAGDFAQAMMDLGATLCTPRNPSCERCPFGTNCQARVLGDPETLPRKKPKKQKPTRRGVAFWVERADGSVLINQRPEKGLLAKMWEVPSSPWEAIAPQQAFSLDMIANHAPVKGDWAEVDGFVKHTFTHFHLELKVMKATTAGRTNPERGQFVASDDLANYAFPTVMKKIIKAAAPNL